jgi:molybdopterin-binding protein
MVLLSFAGHTIKSAITSRSSDILNIQPGDHVTAYIKANEVTLTESTS